MSSEDSASTSFKGHLVFIFNGNVENFPKGVIVVNNGYFRDVNDVDEDGVVAISVPESKL